MKDGFHIKDEIEVKLIKKGRNDKMKDSLKLRGDVIIERRKKDGTVIDKQELKNLIVNVGKERVAKLINLGAAGSLDKFGYIAVGTGTTSPAVGDTGCETEVTRAQADNSGGSYEASYKSVWEKTFTFGSSYAITEAVVSDSASASGEVILDRFTFTAKNVDTDTDLYVKVTVTIS